MLREDVVERAREAAGAALPRHVPVLRVLLEKLRLPRLHEPKNTTSINGKSMKQEACSPPP